MVATVEKEPKKTDFVTEFLGQNPTANLRAVKDAWQKAGYPGTVSQTLVSNLRTKLNLAGNIGSGRKPRGAKTATKTSKAGAKSGRGPGRPRLDANGSHDAHAPASASEKKTRRSARETLLAEIEGEFDRLIYKLIEVGDLAHVEDALRAARRVVVRSHEG